MKAALFRTKFFDTKGEKFRLIAGSRVWWCAQQRNGSEAILFIFVGGVFCLCGLRLENGAAEGW